MGLEIKNLWVLHISFVELEILHTILRVLHISFVESEM